MITNKLCSTISYNSKEFLVNTLDECVKSHTIDFYAFMEHHPEDDETKMHKHLLIVPCGRIDTSALAEKLREPDKDHPNNPLGCIRFVSSKFSDWYLYSLHDPDYLATKAESRTWQYSKEEFVVSDPDYFAELIHTSDFSKFKLFQKFREMVQSGVKFADLFANGFIPVQQVKQYEMAYYLLKGRYEESSSYTCRGGHTNHENNSFASSVPTKEDFEELVRKYRLQSFKRSEQSTLPLS